MITNQNLSDIFKNNKVIFLIVYDDYSFLDILNKINSLDEKIKF